MTNPNIKFADSTAGGNNLHNLNFPLFFSPKFTCSQNWVFETFTFTWLRCLSVVFSDQQSNKTATQGTSEQRSGEQRCETAGGNRQRHASGEKMLGMFLPLPLVQWWWRNLPLGGEAEWGGKVQNWTNLGKALVIRGAFAYSSLIGWERPRSTRGILLIKPCLRDRDSVLKRLCSGPSQARKGNTQTEPSPLATILFFPKGCSRFLSPLLPSPSAVPPRSPFLTLFVGPFLCQRQHLQTSPHNPGSALLLQPW